jgi:hypothetical protein
VPRPARPRLGEILLSRAVCTRGQLATAWEQKVLFGDRLGTNLLATGALDERTLADALAVQHGVHAGHRGVLHVDPDAVARVPGAVAQTHRVVPHHVVDRTLTLLMLDPHDLRAIDEVRFVTGLRIAPVVVCEARMWQLLQTHYGVRVGLRPGVLDGPVARAAPAPAPVAFSSPAELTSEEEFRDLYGGLHGSGAVVVDSAASASAEAQAWRDALRNHRAHRARDMGPAGTDEIPILELTEVAPPEHSADAPFGEALLSAPDALTSDAGSGSFDVDVDVVDAVDESPLDFAAASALLIQATDRDVIARLVLRAARSRFARAALLTAYEHQFVVWESLGEGMEPERVRGLRVDRAQQTVFSLCADSRAPYVGPVQRFVAHGAWVKATGRKIPRTWAVVPILVRGRCVNLLLVDNGHDSDVEAADVSEVVVLAQQIAASYELLLAAPA